jgi:hypothetical protein
MSKNFFMDTKNKCILCKTPARSRGLCETHYAQFARAKRKLAPSQRNAFDEAAVAQKVILPVEDSDNPFIGIAAEVALRLGLDTDIAKKRRSGSSGNKN